MNARRGSILAIESAIAGGSLALIEGGSEIAHWIGNGNVARAEDLLENIDQLFRATGTSPASIDIVAVSAGPGSFTGIRIGIATALGFKNGLGVRMSSISALRAMVMGKEDMARDGQTVAAVPVGRDSVCLQSFERKGETVRETAEAGTLSFEEFDRYLRDGTERCVILHRTLYENGRDLPKVINFGDNLAYAVGLACRLEPAARTTPLFVSKAT